jgi:hypothetical protein
MPPAFYPDAAVPDVPVSPTPPDTAWMQYMMINLLQSICSYVLLPYAHSHRPTIAHMYITLPLSMI